jgi:hypothetical protein
VRDLINPPAPRLRSVPPPNLGGSIPPAVLGPPLDRQPIPLPPPPAARPEPSAAPSWQGWAWVAAAGIFVLSLLARRLRDNRERK